jgi:hypothetical protein
MAVFGAPLSNDRHAADAVLAACGMCKAHDALLEAWKRRGVSAKCGIGLATGEAIVGEMGCKLRTDYTVMGRSPPTHNQGCVTPPR